MNLEILSSDISSGWAKTKGKKVDFKKQKNSVIIWITHLKINIYIYLAENDFI